MIIVKGDDNALIGWRSPIVIVMEKDVALIGFIINSVLKGIVCKLMIKIWMWQNERLPPHPNDYTCCRMSTNTTDVLKLQNKSSHLLLRFVD
jgi:hypothetical protein